MTDYELYHHGIKGQKWGVRRTAAQLGHRTASGLKKAAAKAEKAAGRTLNSAGKFASKQGRKAKKAAVVKAKQTIKETKEKRYYKKLHKKKLSQMTDKEIADLTRRVKTEAALKDAKYESRVQNARKFYKDVAQQPMNEFAKQYGKELAKSMFPNNQNDDGDKKDKKNKKSDDISHEDSSKPKQSKPKKQKESTVEFEVKSSSPKPSKATKEQQKKAFDDYFESEVIKERERRKNS